MHPPCFCYEFNAAKQAAQFYIFDRDYTTTILRTPIELLLSRFIAVAAAAVM